MKLSAAERARRRRQAAAALEESIAEVEAAVALAYRRALMPALALALPRASRGVTAAGDEEVPDLDALGQIPSSWAAQMSELVIPAVAKAFADAVARLLADFDAAAEARRAAAGLEPLEDVVRALQSEWLATASNRLAGVGDGAWNLARASIEEGFAKGETIPQLRDRVSEVIGAGEARARTIARTETTGAANGGALAASKALGSYGPAFKEWLATGDGRTRETHAEADGQQVPIDDTFTVGGYDLDYPGDPYGPAEEVVNCRCTLVYIDAADAASSAGDGPGSAGGGGGADEEALAAAAHATTLPLEEAPAMSVRERRYHDVVRRSFADVPPAPPAPPTPPPADVPPAPAEPDPAPAVEIGRPFEALMTVEGRWTGDQRLIMVGGIEWDGLLPISLTAAHDEDPFAIVGRVTEIERIPNGAEAFIICRGFLDDVGDAGTEAIRLIEGLYLRGVSVDIDDVDLGGIDPATVTNEDDLYWSLVVERARIRALALCPIAAFAEAYITLGAVDTTTLPPPVDGPTPITNDEAAIIESEAEDELDDLLDIVLLAAAGPVRLVADAPSRFSPPASAFARPEADGPTPLTVTPPDEHGIRYVYGHLAEWGTCHTGYPDVCVTAPPSATDYAYFNLTPLLCADGSSANVGRLTVGCGHADTRLGWRDTTAHYDDAGHSAALVSASDGVHGVWVCGIVDPLASEEQAFALASHPLSGDWRSIGGSLELVAALAVNVPGFPVVRTRVASGRQQTLCAAGVLGRPDTAQYRPRSQQQRPGVRIAADLIAAAIGRDPKARAAELARRVHG